jgi:spore coat polysaccharide biosynthesis protein SpsF
MGAPVRPLVVVQARSGSTRLPGKVLLPVAGAPLLERMLERIRAARTPLDLVVATTWEEEDAAISELCESIGVPCFRGHPRDLLDRHYRVGLAFGAEAVVKIPSDCPLIDHAVIDRVLHEYLDDPCRYDFVSNLHPATYPDGNDVEVFSFAALEGAHREATRPLDREHTTPYLWDQPEKFRLSNVAWESGLDLSMSHRFTVDYPEDYELVSAVYAALYREGEVFSLPEILAFLEARPDVFRMNARYLGVNWYRNHLDELRTVGPAHTRSVETVS